MDIGWGKGWTTPSFQQQRRGVVRLRFEPDHVWRPLLHGFCEIMLPLCLMKKKLHFARRSLQMVTLIQWMERMTVLRKLQLNGRSLLVRLILTCDVKRTLCGVYRNELLVVVVLGVMQIRDFFRVPRNPALHLDLGWHMTRRFPLVQLCFLLTLEFARVVVNRHRLLRRGRQDRQWRGPMRTR